MLDASSRRLPVFPQRGWAIRSARQAKDFMNTPRSAAADRFSLPLFQRILCAVDVDQPTTSALGLAGLVAERFGSALEALYVGPKALGEGADAEHRLQQLVTRFGACSSATVRLASGAPARAIVERASVSGCHLIVLGSRERSALGWQFRDDVVRDVSALTACATLTVQDRDMPALLERILVPVDFGPATARVVEWASALALRFEAKLQLLHVVSRERYTVHSADRARNSVRASGVPGDVTAELAALERRLVLLGVDVESQVTVAGGVANGIESFNAQGEFDLCVMGLSGAPESPTRLTRGVVGTLRSRLSIPLLAVRAAASDSEHPYYARAAGKANAPVTPRTAELSA